MEFFGAGEIPLGARTPKPGHATSKPGLRSAQPGPDMPKPSDKRWQGRGAWLGFKEFPFFIRSLARKVRRRAAECGNPAAPGPRQPKTSKPKFAITNPRTDTSKPGLETQPQSHEAQIQSREISSNCRNFALLNQHGKNNAAASKPANFHRIPNSKPWTPDPRPKPQAFAPDPKP